MKNADAMFQELGYENKKQLENLVIYEAEESVGIITTARIIMFDLTKKTVGGHYGTFGGGLSFTIQELNAINKKVEELGWR